MGYINVLNEVTVFDKGTPVINDASKVKTLLATNKDDELIGSIEFELLVQEAGKKFGDAVKLESLSLPTLGVANKRATVLGGSIGKNFSYTDPDTLIVKQLPVGANMIADLFWDGLIKTWEKIDEQPMPSIEVVDGFNSTDPTTAGTGKNDKLLFDQMNIGNITEIPAGYKNASYSTYLSEGYSYYDSRCLITDKSMLNNVNIVIKTRAGNINILAISLSGEVLHSEAKQVSIGMNQVVFTDLSSVTEPFIIGIQLLNGQATMATNIPANGEGYSKWRKDGDLNWTSIAYRLAYSIDLIDGGMKGKLNTFQIMLQSDTTKLRQNLLKSNKVGLYNETVTIEDKIEIPNGATLEGVFGRSVIKIGSGLTTEAFNVEGKEDVTIKGIKIVGTQPNYAFSMNGVNSGVGIINNATEALSNTYKGDEVGMLAKASENLVLENIQFHNINGVGFIGDYVGKTYHRGMKASKLFFRNCYKGIETKSEHEYSNYSDIMVSLCQIGVDVNSGNLAFSSPIITACRYGMIVRGDGYNHAHGIVTGAEIKHHQIAGLLIDNVTNGQYFNGLMMQYANIVIQNSKGIFIPSLFFTNGTITNMVGGKNVIGELISNSNINIGDSGQLIIRNSTNWNL